MALVTANHTDERYQICKTTVIINSLSTTRSRQTADPWQCCYIYMIWDSIRRHRKLIR